MQAAGHTGGKKRGHAKLYPTTALPIDAQQAYVCVCTLKASVLQHFTTSSHSLATFTNRSNAARQNAQTNTR